MLICINYFKMDNRIKFWHLLNESLKDNKNKLEKYEHSSEVNLKTIKELFKEKINSKCLNQMDNFYKNCQVIKVNDSSEINYLPEKETQCKESINLFEKCQKDIQEVYEYYYTIIDSINSFKLKENQLCIKNCNHNFDTNLDTLATKDCLGQCINVMYYGYKSYDIFLSDYKKKIILDLKKI